MDLTRLDGQVHSLEGAYAAEGLGQPGDLEDRAAPAVGAGHVRLAHDSPHNARYPLLKSVLP